jgi:hypothetical protein
MVQETIVLVLLAALATLGALVWILWKPLTKRVLPYFLTWWNRDKIAEAEARKEQVARKDAEKEVAQWGVAGIETEESQGKQRNQAYPVRVQTDSGEETQENRPK